MLKSQTRILASLRGGLIVSCQARRGSPVYGARFMAAFAQCAEMAGAVGFRANGGADVRAIRSSSRLPIIGIKKQRDPRWEAYITPTVAAASEVVRAGAEIVAVDMTHRTRKSGLSPEALIAAIKKELRCLVMADIDAAKEGVDAANAGADLVSTTMAGYTAARAATEGPDLELLRELARLVQVPLICEGRIHSPADVAAAFDAGAYAVVVGTAITNPIWLTQSFARGTPRGAKELNL
jgi:N-acylglucosamine-6-phosphate 2-epimerase